jgi:hypothetical protein
MRHHSAGAPALLTPLQRADNLVVNTMNRRGQVLVKEARSTVADNDVAQAAARSAETICVTIGEILRAFTPTECANYFRNSGYAQS